MKLNEQQVNLAAKYFAVSNTGLIGISVQEPTSTREIESNYNQVSGDYAIETGEGLYEELEMWKHDMQKLKSEEDHFFKQIKSKIPFILEVQ